FETAVERPERNWVFGINHNLPKMVSVSWARVVDEEFHARFSAQHRRYTYIIYNHQVRPALWRTGLSWHYRELDVTRMQQAATALVGKHDFTSFRALECQAKSPVREIHHCTLQQRG